MVLIGKLVYSASTIRLGVYSFQINQYTAANVNHSTTKSQLAAELGPAQPQLVKLSFGNYPCLQALEVHKYEDIENAIKIKD